MNKLDKFVHLPLTKLSKWYKKKGEAVSLDCDL